MANKNKQILSTTHVNHGKQATFHNGVFFWIPDAPRVPKYPKEISEGVSRTPPV